MKNLKKKVSIKTVMFVLLFLAVLGVLSFTGVLPSSSGLALGFTERKTGDSWSADYLYLSGKRSARLKGSEGPLLLDVQTKSGSLALTLQDQEGKEIFSEKFTETSSMEVTAPEEVKIVVSAKGHKGGFEISYSRG